MAVLCRQTAEGEPDQTYTIEAHSEEHSDADMLKAKADGAASKGWVVTWTSSVSFTAKKMRWAEVECTRQFWIE